MLSVEPILLHFIEYVVCKWLAINIHFIFFFNSLIFYNNIEKKCIFHILYTFSVYTFLYTNIYILITSSFVCCPNVTKIIIMVNIENLRFLRFKLLEIKFVYFYECLKLKINLLL